jgi:hypothetical protein
MVDQPEKMWCRSFTPAAELRQLLKEAVEHGVSDESMIVLRRVAAMRPLARLMRNIKVMLTLCEQSDIVDILNQGLAVEERHALIELDSCGLSIPMREVAHGLFNVHERWIVLKSIARLTREAAASADEYAGDRPLDSILGE